MFYSAITICQQTIYLKKEPRSHLSADLREQSKLGLLLGLLLLSLVGRRRHVSLHHVGLARFTARRNVTRIGL
jgi:hypothetical protein